MPYDPDHGMMSRDGRFVRHDPGARTAGDESSIPMGHSGEKTYGNTRWDFLIKIIFYPANIRIIFKPAASTNDRESGAPRTRLVTSTKRKYGGLTH